MKSTKKAITTDRQSGCGRIYMTLVYEDDYTPIKIHITLGKAGGCAASQLNGIQNLINFIIKNGGDLTELFDKRNELSLIGIRCPSLMSDDENRDISPDPEEKFNLSCCDIIAKTLRYLLSKLDEKKANSEKGKK